MIIDAHSHFGKDFYCGDIDLKEYIKICQDIGVTVGFIMPSPWPEYNDENGINITSLIWEHDNYKYKKYFSVVENKKVPIMANPYKIVNSQYYSLIKNIQNSIILEFVPLVHGVLDQPEYLYDLISQTHPKALKMHGFASGFSPEEIRPEICEVIKYFNIPIILHTSVYNYNFGYGLDTRYWRNECHPMRWVKFLQDNNLKGVLNHGACLNDEAILAVNKDDNLMIGIGPDLDISNDFFKVDIDKEFYYNNGYLNLLKTKVLSSKLLFDIDFNWNTSENGLDQNQIQRLSRVWNASDLERILGKNATDYYDLSYTRKKK